MPEKSASPVSFAERVAGSQAFADLFRDGMTLVEETAALHHVRSIHPGGGRFHQHLARARLWHGALLRHEHLRSARGADRDHGHLVGQ